MIRDAFSQLNCGVSILIILLVGGRVEGLSRKKLNCSFYSIHIFLNVKRSCVKIVDSIIIHKVESKEDQVALLVYWKQGELLPLLVVVILCSRDGKGYKWIQPIGIHCKMNSIMFHWFGEDFNSSLS